MGDMLDIGARWKQLESGLHAVPAAHPKKIAGPEGPAGKHRDLCQEETNNETNHLAQFSTACGGT